MLKNCLVVVGCSISLISASAFAENKAAKEERSGYYAEAAYVLTDSKDTTPEFNGTIWKPSLARITFGKEVSENWAVEGFITQGINSVTVVGSKVKQNSGYGIAVRPFIKVTDEIELYGRVGWVRYKETYYGTSLEWTYGLYFWSIGAAYKITDNLSATIDYSKLQNKAEYFLEASNTAVGVRYNF